MLYSFIKIHSVGTIIKPWGSFEEHIGPVDHVTPLGKTIGGKTYCGLLIFCAGVLGWAAERLKHECDVQRLNDLSVALIAFQSDWRYLNIDALPSLAVPEQPWASSLNIGIQQQVRDVLNAEAFWSSYLKPDGMVFYVTHTLGYTMDDQTLAEFHSWIISTCARLDTFARRPEVARFDQADFDDPVALEFSAAPLRGQPLPPQILDPAVSYDHSDASRLYNDCLAAMNWDTNPFLQKGSV